jgi:hypothetical protein
MSENLDRVRSIRAGWDRGNFSSVEWADPEIELVFADGPEPASWSGLVGLAEGWRKFLSAWEDFRTEALEYRELDDERVLVVARLSGRGKTRGVQLARLHASGANLFYLHDGKVRRLVLYMDSDRALADLGLTPEGENP